VNGAQVDDRPSGELRPPHWRSLVGKESRRQVAADSLRKFNRLRCRREPLEPEVPGIPHYFTQNRCETSIIT
jgi:hypothetical protein